MWRRYDLHCSECSGYLKPAVISMGENIPPAVWRDAEQAVADIVVISLDPPARSLAPGDLVLSHKAEEVLPALVLLLDCPDERMWGLVSPGRDRRQATAARPA